MNGKFLLDTNIVIALFANELAVIERLKNAEEIFIPSVVIGELYYGAQKSQLSSENLIRIDDFVQQNTILACNAETARHYGSMKEELRKKGRPIPENDLWIAAIARQHDLTLVSRDAHFQQIDLLRIERW
jgi:tRNA(fMet)-specific endonuclease VapC